MTPSRIVIALGGNAISPEHGRGDIPEQFDQSRATAHRLANLIEAGWTPLITHGNGPQVGNVLRRVELAAAEVYPLPLDVCVADTQGGMGYMIAQCLTNELSRRAISRTVSAIVTRVEVAANDPAFLAPTKPVGGFYDRTRALEFQARAGWRMIEIAGHGWRRVVPSPKPTAVLEIELLRRLLAVGEIVIAGGGGGVPVTRTPNGEYAGVEAVIDKDRTSALLARQLGVPTLLIATGVERVATGYGTTRQRDHDQLKTVEARELLAHGEFPPGSMGPKIEAALDFLANAENTAARVIICHLDQIQESLEGRNGTCISN